jgi:phosphohistidine phosphatase
MPKILLVRHAKAEAPSDTLSDHDRALTLAGRSAASELAVGLAKADLVPTVVLVSSAVRALQTWKLMASALEGAEVRVCEDLYETDVDGLLAEVNAVEGDSGIVAVIGHEPTMSAAAAFLAGSASDTTSLQRVAHGLPTGNAALLEFDGAWSDLGQRGAKLTAIYSSQALY